MKRVAVVSGVLAAAIFLALQFVPLEFPRDNPPATATISGPPEVVDLLRRSCFDCHSNETRWRWYAYVAPLSWKVTVDVAAGRSRLNLSEWENLRDPFKRRNARQMVERIEKGEMPMQSYAWMHREAQVNEQDLDLLRAWRDRLNAEPK